MSDATSGDKNHMYGKGHTEETRRKISDRMSGENAHQATITEATVKLILIRISEGVKDRPISEEYDTTVAVVHGIRSGRSWKHIKI